MADNARRYNLSLGNIISYGIGVSGSTEECSILVPFSVNLGGCTYNYPGITTEQLGLIKC